jgi:hypothetical protein
MMQKFGEALLLTLKGFGTNKPRDPNQGDR